MGDIGLCNSTKQAVVFVTADFGADLKTKKASKHPVFRDFLREASGRYRVRLLSTSGCQNRLAVWETENLAYKERVRDLKNNIENEEWILVIDGGSISPDLIIEYGEAMEDLEKHKAEKPWF